MFHQALSDIDRYILIIFIFDIDFENVLWSQNGVMPTRKAYFEAGTSGRQPSNKLLEVLYQLYSNVFTTFVQRVHVDLNRALSRGTENPLFQELP